MLSIRKKSYITNHFFVYLFIYPIYDSYFVVMHHVIILYSLKVFLHDVPQVLFQVFQQGLGFRGPPSRSPAATGPDAFDNVTININAHAALVVRLGPIHEIFTKPDSQLHVLLKIQWILEVGEDQFIGVFVINYRHVVPQTCAMLYELLQREDSVVLFVRDHHVQRIRLEAGVVMATPAAVVRHVRYAPYLAISVRELQSTQQHALRASVDHVTWAVVSGLEADWGTKIDFVPSRFNCGK